MTSSLLTATGSDYGMLTTNPHFNDTGLFHMYITGMTSLFNYGDHGPNKYSTTANSMIFMGGQFKIPQYMLHQRDRIDAPEPTAMFWYDPSVTGMSLLKRQSGFNLLTVSDCRRILGWHAS